jgi:hypothetical protein
MMDDKKLADFLLKVFPLLETDEQQRHSAARWAQVIVLYFRCRKTRLETADEMRDSIQSVRAIVRSIYRIMAGKTTRGTQRIKYGPGRPIGSKTNKDKIVDVKKAPRRKRVPDPLTSAERVARFRRRKAIPKEIDRVTRILEYVRAYKSERLPHKIYFTLVSLLKRLWVEKMALDAGKRYVRKYSDSVSSRSFEQKIVAEQHARLFPKLGL